MSEIGTLLIGIGLFGGGLFVLLVFLVGMTFILDHTRYGVWIIGWLMFFGISYMFGKAYLER